MSLFKPAGDTRIYFKSGFLAFQGGGKTFTSMLVAIGLHKYINSPHPVYMYDSEKGADYIKDNFKKAGIPFEVVKSRSFMTLIGAMKAVPDDAIFLIDSITHPWRDLMISFMKAKGITRIKMNHWPAIKSEWGQFNDWFLNSKVHIIMSGRAGFEFDFEEDEEGNKDLIKTGVKMKAEGEIGFEPSLLVELSGEQVMENGKVTGIKIKAFIMKDRFDVMNGKTFENPTFETFLPHISLLNLTGEYQSLDGVDSSVMFSNDQSVSQRLRERDILIEELFAEMPLRFNSRTDEGKKEGAGFLRSAYGTLSKTAIENMSNERIKEGLDKLKALPLLTMETTPASVKQEVKEKKGKK